METPLTIALLGKNFIDWGGGIDFLHNCANGLAQAGRSRPLKLYLLLPEKGRAQTAAARLMHPLKGAVKDILARKAPVWRPYRAPDYAAVEEAFRDLRGRLEIARYRDSAGGLDKAMRRLRADVLLPVFLPLDRDFPHPWVGYLYDFQHRHLPHFFTPREIGTRDEVFGRMLRNARVALVNSRAVRDDARAFFPGHACEVMNLPFAPVPAEEWFEEWPEAALRATYGLPERYFIISNQFWVHKDHGTAFEALARLRAAHPALDVHIVCTGKQEDGRFPDYFRKLREKTVALGVADRVHFLGHIPKLDQIRILRGAVATLQPTLFEGGPGGGAVYDSVASGVPALVSDIPINTEIAEDGVAFFRTGDAADLAARMNEQLLRPRPPQDAKILMENGRLRAEALGERLLEIARIAIRRKND